MPHWGVRMNHGAVSVRVRATGNPYAASIWIVGIVGRGVDVSCWECTISLVMSGTSGTADHVRAYYGNCFRTRHATSFPLFLRWEL